MLHGGQGEKGHGFNLQTCRSAWLVSSWQARPLRARQSSSPLRSHSLQHLACVAPFVRRVTGAAGSSILLSVLLCCQDSVALARQDLLTDLLSTDASKARYEAAVVKTHASKSLLPSTGEARLLMQLNKELFEDDAWEGMKMMVKVAEVVESKLESEKEAGCGMCRDNRLLVEKAWQIIANEYYDPQGRYSQAAWAQQLLSEELKGPFQTKTQSYNAIQSMMASLNDRYTEFLTPTQFRRALRRPMPTEREYLERQYTGIGLQLGQHSSRGGWLVEGPLAESPAEESGILPGQRLIEIGGYPADLLTPLEISALMRGPAGSEILLTVADPSGPHPRVHSIRLERRTLPQPPIKAAQMVVPAGKLQYIRIHYFSSETSKAFLEAVSSADKSGCSGIVLDLRNNPGGVFEEAIYMASLLLDDGCVIAKTVRNSEVVDNTFRVGALSQQIFPSERSQVTALPIAVLVNHGSASASEVFAGALQDNNRAVLVGEKTFGKGVVQHYFPFPDGSGLKVTVLKYLTPRGQDISHNGGLSATVTCADFPHLGPPHPESDTCIKAALSAVLKRT